MSNERVAVDYLVEIVRMPNDIVVIDEVRERGYVPLRDLVPLISRATVQYLVENGLVTPCLESEVPDLLPTRVGQGPASLQGDLRALLDLDTGERQVNEEEEL